MAEEPAGLDLSLDDIIATSRTEKKNRLRDRGGRRYEERGDDFEQGAPRRHRPRVQQQQQVHRQSYRENQSCFVDEAGTTIFQFHKSELVRITPVGDITLNADGHHGTATLASFNDALNPLGVKVTAASGIEGQWSVSDGKSLVRFADGIIMPGKGPMHHGRGRAMLDAFQNRSKSDVSHLGRGAAPPPPPPMGHGHVGASVFSRINGGHKRMHGTQRYAPY